MDRVAKILRGMAFATCSDLDVGKLGGELEARLETTLRPAVPLQPNAGGGGIGDKGATGPYVTSTAGTPADAFRREMTQLVERYRSKLTRDQLDEIVASVTAPPQESALTEHDGGG